MQCPICKSKLVKSKYDKSNYCSDCDDYYDDKFSTAYPMGVKQETASGDFIENKFYSK